MGRFTEDMGRLRDEIESDRIARQNLIADTRDEVTAAAHAFMSDLRSSVDALQTSFREAHADMAEAARADRNAFLARLGGAVADIRAEAADRQAAVRDALAESAAEARTERATDLTRMRGDVARMQDGFRRARGEMALEVKAAGQSFVAGIVGAVGDLQRQTMAMVGDFSSERGAARMAWRGEAPKAKAKPAAPPPPPPPAAARAKPQAKPHPKAQAKPAEPAPAPKPAEKPAEKAAVAETPPPREGGEGFPQA